MASSPEPSGPLRYLHFRKSDNGNSDWGCVYCLVDLANKPSWVSDEVFRVNSVNGIMHSGHSLCPHCHLHLAPDSFTDSHGEKSWDGIVWGISEPLYTMKGALKLSRSGKLPSSFLDPADPMERIERMVRNIINANVAPSAP